MTPDVLPKLLVEIRDDADVDALVAGRVRGFEPAAGDARPKGSYQAFVVLVGLPGDRQLRAPTQRANVVARCYGSTPANAAAVRWAVSNAIQNARPRLHANGLGIYTSMETSGGEQEKDPDTQQPYQELVITALATTVEVGA